jgi:hypothetical protein
MPVAGAGSSMPRDGAALWVEFEAGDVGRPVPGYSVFPEFDAGRGSEMSQS